MNTARSLLFTGETDGCATCKERTRSLGKGNISPSGKRLHPPSPRPTPPGEGELSAGSQQDNDPSGRMVSGSWAGGIAVGLNTIPAGFHGPARENRFEGAFFRSTNTGSGDPAFKLGEFRPAGLAGRSQLHPVNYLVFHQDCLPSPALASISEMEGRELIGGAGNPGRPSRCSVALGYYLSPLSGLKKGGRLPQPMSLLTNRKSMLHSSIIS